MAAGGEIGWFFWPESHITFGKGAAEAFLVGPGQ